MLVIPYARITLSFPTPPNQPDSKASLEGRAGKILN